MVARVPPNAARPMPLTNQLLKVEVYSMPTEEPSPERPWIQCRIIHRVDYFSHEVFWTRGWRREMLLAMFVNKSIGQTLSFYFLQPVSRRRIGWLRFVQDRALFLIFRWRILPFSISVSGHGSDPICGGSQIRAKVDEFGGESTVLNYTFCSFSVRISLLPIQVRM
jgi:hypothetical protein